MILKNPMGGGARSFGIMRRVFWPALALIIVGNFAGYAVAGPNGLLAWGGYHRDLQERKIELAQLEAEKAQLRHRSTLLDPRKADPDMEEGFDDLDAPVLRVTNVDVPLPYAANLEKLALIKVADVVAAAKKVCYRQA